MDRSPPRVATFAYSTRTRLTELAPGLYDFFGFTRPDRRHWTTPELFRYVEQFGDAMSLVVKSVRPESGDRWQGRLVLRIDGVRRAVHVAVRNGAARDDWRGLLFDSPQPAEPVNQFLELATLEAMRAPTNETYVALMDLVRARLIRWVTDPLPGIQWKGVVDDRDTPHPDDVARIYAAAFDILSNGADQLQVNEVRLRRIGGGWTVVDAAATVLAHAGAPSLVLVALTVVGKSDDPDPTSPS